MFSSSSSSSSSSSCCSDDNSCDKKDGLSLLIWSQVPLNRGVSSSASVEVAVMNVIAHIFGISIHGELLATASQWVENEICNSACGLMDQMAVTLGSPFMIMKCQPAIIYTNNNNTSTNTVPSLPDDLIIYAIDSGVSHEISGIEYEAARVAAFMGYKMICDIEGLDVIIDNSSEIKRYTDIKYKGYLANLTPSQFSRLYEDKLPIKITGREYLDLYGYHVDPATNIRENHIYNVRANTKYAIYENNRVTLFYHLLNGCKKKIGEGLCQYEVMTTT
jgi:L-arabinokinase